MVASMTVLTQFQHPSSSRIQLYFKRRKGIWYSRENLSTIWSDRRKFPSAGQASAGLIFPRRKVGTQVRSVSAQNPKARSELGAGSRPGGGGAQYPSALRVLYGRGPCLEILWDFFRRQMSRLLVRYAEYGIRFISGPASGRNLQLGNERRGLGSVPEIYLLGFFHGGPSSTSCQTN